MKKIKANFKLSRVHGKREIISWYNNRCRAQLAYQFAQKEGFDYIQLVRVSNGNILSSDGVKPDWFDRVQ